MPLDPRYLYVIGQVGMRLSEDPVPVCRRVYLADYSSQYD
jgi:hypothetical protein